MGAKKVHRLSIDSGATPNFVLDKILLKEYEIMTKETVTAALGALRYIIGKAKLHIPIYGGRKVLGYHDIQFDTHILLSATQIQILISDQPLESTISDTRAK